ncbi:MAG: hypothetical protein LRS49_00095, partial [Desulfurococcales archaeon]|nr:hypothetical protein [Desulfurococcales archaeon]
FTGAGLGEPLTIRVTALESRPYVDITVRVLEAFGGRVERSGYTVFTVSGPLRASAYRVPGDWSSAAPLLAAAAAAGGRVVVEGLDPRDPQPDRMIVELLEVMGASCRAGGGSVECSGPGAGGLRGFEACVRDSPDLAPLLASLASLACGVSRICCAERLRLKESDRVETSLALARSLGAEAWLEEEPGRGLCIAVRGVCGPPRCRGPLSGMGDHRVAMAAAVAALASREPCLVEDAGVVSKSFPGFWEALRRLGARVERV